MLATMTDVDQQQQHALAHRWRITTERRSRPAAISRC